MDPFFLLELFARGSFHNVYSLHLVWQAVLRLRKDREVLLEIPILEVLFTHLQDGVELLLMLDLGKLSTFVGTFVIV